MNEMEMHKEVQKILKESQKDISRSITYNYKEVFYLKKEAQKKIELLDGLEELMEECEDLRSILNKINNIYKKKG